MIYVILAISKVISSVVCMFLGIVIEIYFVIYTLFVVRQFEVTTMDLVFFTFIVSPYYPYLIKRILSTFVIISVSVLPKAFFNISSEYKLNNKDDNT